MTNTTDGGEYQIKIEILNIKTTAHMEVSERCQRADIKTKFIVSNNRDEIFLEYKNVLGKITKRIAEGRIRKQFTKKKKTVNNNGNNVAYDEK